MSDIPAWKRKKIARDAAYRAEHYSRVVMEIPKDRKARLQAAAEANGMSLTAFILACCERAGV